MKLIGYELKKIFSSKGILLLAVALLVANAALNFFLPSGTAPERSDEEYIAGYRDDIRRVIRLAERNIADLSAGGDGFVVDYQRKVIEKYTALAESGQTPAPISGWSEYVSLTGRVTLLLAWAVVTGSAVMLCEQDHGMLSFLCISKKGVGAYKAKLWLLLFLSAGSAAVFSAADLAVCGIKYGFSGMHAPLVSVRSMEFCPYAVSIAGYIVIQYAAVTLLAFAAAVLSALIGKLSGSYIFTFLCGGAVCGALYASALMSTASLRATVRSICSAGQWMHCRFTRRDCSSRVRSFAQPSVLRGTDARHWAKGCAARSECCSAISPHCLKRRQKIKDRAGQNGTVCMCMSLKRCLSHQS